MQCLCTFTLFFTAMISGSKKKTKKHERIGANNARGSSCQTKRLHLATLIRPAAVAHLKHRASERTQGLHSRRRRAWGSACGSRRFVAPTAPHRGRRARPTGRKISRATPCRSCRFESACVPQLFNDMRRRGGDDHDSEALADACAHELRSGIKCDPVVAPTNSGVLAAL